MIAMLVGDARRPPPRAFMSAAARTSFF